MAASSIFHNIRITDLEEARRFLGSLRGVRAGPCQAVSPHVFLPARHVLTRAMPRTDGGDRRG